MNEKLPKYIKILIPIILVSIIIMWLVFPLILKSFYSTSTESQQFLEIVPNVGLFGDLYGSLNALFSGLAFGGVIITLLLQREELIISRKEIEIVRQDIDTSKEAMLNQKESYKEQANILERQQFEVTFFNLLKLNKEISSSITLLIKEGKEKKSYKGREAIRKIFESDFKVLYKKQIDSQKIELICDGFFDNNGAILKQYFSSIYLLISFTDNSRIEEKSLYFRLIWNQMTKSELGLLIYFGISTRSDDLKDYLISHYKDHIRDLLLNIDHRRFYELE